MLEGWPRLVVRQRRRLLYSSRAMREDFSPEGDGSIFGVLSSCLMLGVPGIWWVCVAVSTVCQQPAMFSLISAVVVKIQSCWRGYLGRLRARLAREGRDKRLRQVSRGLKSRGEAIRRHGCDMACRPSAYTDSTWHTLIVSGTLIKLTYHFSFLSPPEAILWCPSVDHSEALEGVLEQEDQVWFLCSKAISWGGEALNTRMMTHSSGQVIPFMTLDWHVWPSRERCWCILI